jgi:RNA polymerase sigma factor (TIGR02999 family)
MAAPAPDITTLLQAWRAGDPAALDELTPIVYDHLRQLGRQYVRHERPDVRGDATSLVHEAFVRLVDARAVSWHDRAHFLAVCARIMRRVLVDAVRAGAAAKRGGGWRRAAHDTVEELDRIPAAGTERAREICALDDALRVAFTLRSRSSTGFPDANIWVARYPWSGVAHQVTTENGHHPAWLPDGRLSYRTGSTSQEVVEITLTPSFRMSNPQLLVGGSGLPNIPAGETRSYDLLPNGRVIAIGHNLAQAALWREIHIVENSFTELRELASRR